MAKTDNRATFGKLGVILATAGSAVGLGNIWRFPYMLGSNGGAAFLLVYIGCVLLLGIPLMIAEFYLGRHTHRNTAGAFKAIAPGTKWSLIGYNSIWAAFLILGYYSVIAGWTLEYIVESLSGDIAGKSAEQFSASFNAFSTDAVRPVIWTLAFIVMTHIFIASGVKKGIERASKWMMPLLFIILVALCFRSITLPNASEGLKFLFQPDFTKITPSVVLSALGQAFFSLSIAMGCLITYSSYFNKETNLPKTAVQVATLDTVVAILAGVMIFPAVFSFGIAPTAGPELVFITLPNVFAQLPAGWFWSFVFFVLLALAALTSTISLHEVVTAYIHEEFKNITRKQAAVFVSIGVGIIGIISSLSFGLLHGISIFGLTIFDALDFFTAKIMLTVGGFFICLFIALKVSKKDLREELTNGGKIRFRLFDTVVFFIKYICPVLIALIFLNQLGIF